MRQKSIFLFSIILIGVFSRAALAQNLVPANAQPAAIIYEEGIKLMRGEKYSEAARKFETVIELESANAEAYNALGTVYVHLNRKNDAYASFQKAIQLAPAFANAYYNLGNLYDRDGRANHAADCFRQSVERKPDYALAWYALGNVSLGSKNYDEAVSAFEKAARLDSRNARVFVYLGYAYNLAGKKQKALDSYRRAVILNSEDREARNNLAVTLYENHSFVESLAEYKTLVSKFPDYPEAYFNLGVLHLAMKNKVAAIGQLTELKRLGSTLETELLYLIHSDKILRVKGN
jgi:Flp pilus assembly protein TadD